MQKARFVLFILVSSLVLPISMYAQFEGEWKTKDDETGEEKSYISISMHNGELEGRISKLLTVEESTLCYTCKDEFYNKPLIGMRILWGFEIDEHGEISSGKIMDPENGKIYSCKLDVVNGGQTLKVRGYIGTPILGRTQKWQRLD